MSLNHQPWLLPENHIIRASITRIANCQVHLHLTLTLGVLGQFQPQFLSIHNRRHRVHPCCWPARTPDVAHCIKPPQPILPITNIGGQLRSILRLGRAPPLAHFAQQERGILCRQQLRQGPQVFGIELFVTRHLIGCSRVLHQAVPMPQQRVDVALQFYPSIQLHGLVQGRLIPTIHIRCRRLTNRVQ